MDNTINSDLIRGHINTIILKALYEGDRYGYDIIKDIEQKSSGQYQLKQPTLYSCLKRLETQGFISSYWGAKSNGGRRKYYALTDMGRELFIQNQTEWEYSRTVIDKLISDKQFDLSSVISSGSTELAMEDEDGDIITEEAPEEAAEDESPAKSEAEQTLVTEVADEESVVERSVPESEDTSVTDVVSEPQSKYPDPSVYLAQLFDEKRHGSDESSYSEKLYNEQVEPTAKLQADNFFKDFTDEYEEPEQKSDSLPPISVILEPEPEPIPSAPIAAVADTASVQAPVEFLPPVIEEPEEDDAVADTHFMRYDTPIESADENTMTIQREYKNILSELLTPPIQESILKEPETSAPPVTPIANHTVETSVPEPEEKPVLRTEERQQAGKFEQLASNGKDLGEGIKIRRHNSTASKTYSTQNYYYSNKLMLYHYGIVFGICLLEIIVMFLAMSVGYGIRQYSGTVRVDMILYGLAVVAALLFPLIAAVRNYANPTMRKRADFNLKSALIFRASLTLILLVLIYLINMCCGMKVTSAAGYIPSLVIPMVMSSNLIISTLVFNLLYTGKKFAVKD